MSEERGFTIRDRRKVGGDSSEDRPDEDRPDEETPERPPETSPEAEDAEKLPTIDFSTFVLSLGTSAMVHLGAVSAPDGKVEKNLPLAKQTIDIIALLQEKTRGNLVGEEEKLIADLLYDLRLRFVSAS